MSPSPQGLGNARDLHETLRVEFPLSIADRSCEGLQPPFVTRFFSIAPNNLFRACSAPLHRPQLLILPPLCNLPLCSTSPANLHPSAFSSLNGVYVLYSRCRRRLKGSPFQILRKETHWSHDAFIPLPDGNEDFALNVLTYRRDPLPLYKGVYIISGRVVLARNAQASESEVAPVLQVFALSSSSTFLCTSIRCPSLSPCP